LITGQTPIGARPVHQLTMSFS